MIKSKWLRNGLLTLLVLGVLAFLFLPARKDFNPMAIHPKEAPVFEGVFAPNDLLATGTYLGENQLFAPEDTAIDEQGNIFAGSSDGYIKRIKPDGTIEVYVYTGGHPLGMDFAPNGDLYVCEPTQGLLRVTTDKEVSLIADWAGDHRIGFADDVKVADNGMVYFSDATWKYGLDDYIIDGIETGGYGRLVSYNPETTDVSVLLSDLQFANGIAISSDNDYLLLNESSYYRVHKFWIGGEKKGQHEILIDNLIAMPDGLALDSNGNYMITFHRKRSVILDFIHPYPFIKNIIAKLPLEAIGEPEPFGMIAVFTPEGEFIKSYQDLNGEFADFITSVEEYNGQLLLGSLKHDRLIVIDK